MTETPHNRHKITIYSGEESVITLGVPKTHSPAQVVLIAQREMSRIPAATHAIIRSVSGNTVEITATDGWIKAQMAAMKLRG